MKLYEYEGKKIFQDYGIKIAQSLFIGRGDSFEKAESFLFPCMVKSQILQGGRGKAGGIREAHSYKQAVEISRDLLSKPLKGEMLDGVLLEEKISIDKEFYLGITIEDVSGKPLLILSTQGGMDIEAVAPEDLKKAFLEPDKMLQLFEAVEICKSVGLNGPVLLETAKTILSLETVFHKMDANLVEINPLIVTPDLQVIAGDAKIIVDDYSLFHHTDISARKELEADEDEFERRAEENDYTLVRLGGDIAVISVGAGYGMAIVDCISHYGGQAANFSDQMGGKSFYNTIDGVLEMTYEDKNVKAAVMGFILSASSLANVVESVRKSLADRPARIPIFGCIRAASAALLDMDMETARSQLAEVDIPLYSDVREAVKAAIAYHPEKEGK